MECDPKTGVVSLKRRKCRGEGMGECRFPSVKFDIGQKVFIVYFCGGLMKNIGTHYAVSRPITITGIRIDGDRKAYYCSAENEDQWRMFEGRQAFATKEEAETLCAEYNEKDVQKDIQKRIEEDNRRDAEDAAKRKPEDGEGY